MTLTASSVTAEDQQAFAVPQRSWQVLLQFKLQRMVMTWMKPGVEQVYEKFEGDEIKLLLSLVREHNRKQEKQGQ